MRIPKELAHSEYPSPSSKQAVADTICRPQEIHVGLGCQKVRVEAVPQLMGKQPADQIVAVGPDASFGDNRMSGIDLDGQVIGACDDVLFWFPHQVHMNAPIIFVAAWSELWPYLQMERQDSGRKKLPVRNLAALFIEKLLDTLVIHSCQRVEPPFFRYAVADFRLGAKIGSRMVQISASRSSSSAVALLMMVLECRLVRITGDLGA